MFLNSFRKGLPKCKVSHYIRQSYLYETDKKFDIYYKISKDYPLPYYYIQRGYTTSFYYNKNNLISYYIHSTRDNSFNAIPLYNYVKNKYDVILSARSYNFMNHSEVYAVRAPNRQIYLIVPVAIISNVSKGTLLYSPSHDVTHLFHSMPIANSFVLVVMSDDKKITIHVIDLIKEKRYIQKYPVKKIIETMLSLLKEDSMEYKLIKHVEKLKKISFDSRSKSNINNSTNDLVFYDKCVVNIDLSFERTKPWDRRTLKNAISVVATYQDSKLTVRLQINSCINVEVHFHYHEVDFGTSTVLTSGNYEIDKKYDISKSHLYSVIASAGDYTIISESNISLNRVVLYYKDEPSLVFPGSHLAIKDFGGASFIRAFDKIIFSISKDRLNKLDNTNQYYIVRDDSHIGIISANDLRKLILDSVRENNNTNWTGADITDMVKYVNLKNKLEEMVRLYVNCDYLEYLFYTYYIDYDAEELYLLVYFQCLEKDGNNMPEFEKFRLYFFKDKINRIFSKHVSFRLVWKFETTDKKFDMYYKISNDAPRNIVDMLLDNVISGDYSKILRLFSKKWNTGNGLINLKVFEIYDKQKAYYDYKHNRMSINESPKDTHVACNLHLVYRIMPIA